MKRRFRQRFCTVSCVLRVEGREEFMTHFVPVTLCVIQKTHVNQQAHGMTHNVTGTKCVMGLRLRDCS